MNIELFEGQTCLVHVKLTDEWEVYGGTPKGEFRAERESSDTVLVTVPSMEADFTPLVPYELFARRILDGREWLVLSGQLHVRRRYSDAGGGVSAIEYFVEPKLVEDGISSSPQIIVGIPGPQGPKGDKGEPGDGNVTAEAIQAVAPIAWDETSVTFGEGASNPNADSVVLGAQAKTTARGSVSVGVRSECGISSVSVGSGATSGEYSIAFGTNAASFKFGVAIGAGSMAKKENTAIGSYSNANASRAMAIGYAATVSDRGATGITIGAAFTENTPDGDVTHTCQTQGTGSITIGAGANTKNNGDTESSNSVTIGCKALNQGADSVVIGAGASGSAAGSVVIGAGAENKTTMGKAVAIGVDASVEGYQGSCAVGHGASSGYYGVSLGYVASAKQSSVTVGSSGKAANGATALGFGAAANAECSIALGYTNTVADVGVAAIQVQEKRDSPTAKTKFYLVGANTPLATQYYNGEAFMGYTVTDSTGKNVLACGTRRMSELFPDNSLTQPASLDENGEWVAPKVFHPSDLDMPQEEPSETEEYQPLPVYPIVEPSDIFGDNGTLEQGDTENTSPETNS